jgi:hypothetical protein
MPLSRNLGTLTSWDPLGLSRPLTGLLYLLPHVIAGRKVFRKSYLKNKKYGHKMGIELISAIVMMKL